MKVNQPATSENTKTATVAVLMRLPSLPKTDTVTVLKWSPFLPKTDTVAVFKTLISSLRRVGIIPKKGVRSASSSRPPFVVMPLTDTPRGFLFQEVRHA
jgi:hypothetical protein